MYRHNIFQFLLIVTLIINNSASFAQKKGISDVDTFLKTNKYINQFEQEKFFLHTNKTTYYPGEKIWFKAYVASDLYNNPYLKTSNLYLNFYDPNMELISSQLFFVEQGVTNGEISLPIDISTGDYYIQLETQFSQNFKDKYVVQVNVINSNDKNMGSDNEDPEVINDSLEVAFYPESGVLLERTDNNIVIKATYGKRPIVLTGEIVDTKTGRKITDLKTDNQGIAVFSLFQYPDREYEMLVNFQDKQRSFNLPKANEKGVVIEKKEATQDQISFKLKTNNATLETNSGKYLYGVLHRKGVAQQIFPFKLDAQYAFYSIDIDVKTTLEGINTFTLFNDRNEKISERTFYVSNDRPAEIKIQNKRKHNDSLFVNFKLLESEEPLNLSISVLPAKTRNYRNFQNILTAFLIDPYIPAHSFASPAFFEGKISEEDLDNYLMTLNDVNSFLNKDLSEDDLNNFEQGLSISGNVYAREKYLENGRVMLSSKENNIILIKELRNINQFSFDSLYLKQPSSFKLALLDKAGKVVKASFTLKETFSEYSPKQKLDAKKEELNALNSRVASTGPLYISSPLELDEVILEGKKNRYDFSELTPDPKILGGTFNKEVKINKNLYKANNSMLDVIRDLPGVRASLEGAQKLKIRSNRGPKSIVEGGSAGKDGTNFDMTIMINGRTVSNFEVLREFSANDIKSIKVNGLGAGYGMQGMNGVILIETVSNIESLKQLEEPGEKNTFLSSVDFGFSQPSPYYEDAMLNFPSKLSRDYFSSIGWIPNFDISPEKNQQLEIDLKGNDEILLIINGLSKSGKMIYNELKIPVNNDY